MRGLAAKIIAPRARIPAKRWPTDYITRLNERELVFFLLCIYLVAGTDKLEGLPRVFLAERAKYAERNRKARA